MDDEAKQAYTRMTDAILSLVTGIDQFHEHIGDLTASIKELSRHVGRLEERLANAPAE